MRGEKYTGSTPQGREWKTIPIVPSEFSALPGLQQSLLVPMAGIIVARAKAQLAEYSPKEQQTIRRATRMIIEVQEALSKNPTAGIQNVKFSKEGTLVISLMSPKKLQNDWIALQDRRPPYITYKMHRPLKPTIKPGSILPVITIITNISGKELRTNDLLLERPKIQGQRRLEEVIIKTTGQQYQAERDWSMGVPINDPHRIISIILGTAQVRGNSYDGELYPFPVNTASYQGGAIQGALPPVTLVPVFLKEK